MTLLARRDHATYCPYKGDCAQRVRYRPNRFRGDRGPTIACSNRRWSRSVCLGSSVNPCQARRFAQATGKLAKTDRLMLAPRIGAVLDLETRTPASKTVEALRELVNARDALIKDRVAALNRQAIAVSAPSSNVSSLQRLRQIDGQIEAIDRRLKTLRNADSGPVPAVRHLDEHSRHRRVTANVLVVKRRPSSGVSSTPRLAPAS